MTASTIEAGTAHVICLADYRRAKPAALDWGTNLTYCCLYAERLKTEYRAEEARIRLECMERGVRHWWEGPQDIRDRVNFNNLKWELYRSIIKHLASMPASTRSEAHLKRATIGTLWLRKGGDFSRDLRAGCEADDHLFPKSLKLVRGK